MRQRSLIGATILGAALVTAPMFAAAQGIDIGKREYDNHCAVCHGVAGKGDGPLADLIKQKPPDLSVLKKNSNGVFPFNRAYEVIDGRQAVAAHGPRGMPVWGQVYNESAPDWLGLYAAPGDYASFVRGRILALIAYIDSLQAK